MKKIPLTKGKFAIVDSEDYPLLSRHNWYYTNHKNNKGYAATNQGVLYMHNLISPAPKGMFVSHENGDFLDNRKENLIFLHYGILQHRKIKSNNKTSKYKGVWWDKRGKRWMASIRKNGKRYHLGASQDESYLAKLYNKKALEFFGPLAYQNKI